MKKKKENNKQLALLDLFQTTMREVSQHYKDGYTQTVSKAGNKQYAGNIYINPLKESATERWRHLGNLRADLKNSWDLDASTNLDKWIGTYIRDNKLNAKQVKELGEYFGYEDFINWVYEISFFGSTEQNQDDTLGNSSAMFEWNPTFSERDFLKIAYALFFSKTLKTEKNEITEFVVCLAEQLNFPLGNSWKSNFSRTSYSNNDFDHTKIFDDLKSAYSSYHTSKEKKRKSNTKN